MLRVSPSWIRFGTFEYFAHNNNHKELKELLDYTIAKSYPNLADKDNSYLLFFKEVVKRTLD